MGGLHTIVGNWSLLHITTDSNTKRVRNNQKSGIQLGCLHLAASTRKVYIAFGLLPGQFSKQCMH